MNAPRLDRYGDEVDDDSPASVTPIRQRQRQSAQARCDELRRILREAKARRKVTT